MKFKNVFVKLNFKKICFFCGSRSGSNYKWTRMAQDLGEKIGRNNWHVVYGGGKCGLMGETAESALRSGSKVIGVITEDLLNMESSLKGLSQLCVVDSMAERKMKMIKISDIFLILPGGLGTLDELFDVWTTKQLNLHNKIIILLNYEHYFDDLIIFLEKTVTEGFLTENHKNQLKICNTIDEAILEISVQMQI